MRNLQPVAGWLAVLCLSTPAWAGRLNEPAVSPTQKTAQTAPPAQEQAPDPEETQLPDDSDDSVAVDIDDAPPVGASGVRAPPLTGTVKEPELTDDQAMAIGFGAMCCCFVGFAALIGGVIYLLVRKKPAAHATQVSAPPSAPPAAAAPAAMPGRFHLSVLALGMPTEVMGRVEQQLLAEGTVVVPVTAAERAALVRVVAARLKSAAPSWSHFGYGEHLDLSELSAAERSFRLASDDFRGRAANGSTPGSGTLRVVTLIVCATRQARGVARLDERAQIEAMLDDRARLLDAELLGVELLWSAPLSEGELLSRYPEMHAIAR